MMMKQNTNGYNPLFMQRAIVLSEIAHKTNKGLPIGCVITRDNKIVGEGHNEIFMRNNPTAHGEMVAIEDACRNEKTILLEGCDLYTTLEPCPMCFGAIYWAKISHVYFANTSRQASEVGFDDSFIFEELIKTPEQRRIHFAHKHDPSALHVLREWKLLNQNASQPWT